MGVAVGGSCLLMNAAALPLLSSTPSHTSFSCVPVRAQTKYLSCTDV